MNTIPAAWYDDPAGSGGKRWWDGVAWSEHVQPAEPPSFQPVQSYQPAAVESYQPVQSYQPQQYQPVQSYQPQQSYQSYQPAQSYQPEQPASSAVVPMAPAYSPFGQGGSDAGSSTGEYKPMQHSPSSAAATPWYVESAQRGPVSNSAGWTSLIAGVIGLGIVVVSSVLGSHVYVLYFPLLIAVGSGVRALAQRAAGTSTSLFAPIVGILCSLAAGALFLSVALTGVSPIAPPDVFDPTTNSERFPNNAEMGNMLTAAYDITTALDAQYPYENWPDTLTADAEGVIASDGAVLGKIAPGETFVYTKLGSDYTFTINGTVPGEKIIYDSDTLTLTAECLDTDLTCGETPLS